MRPHSRLRIQAMLLTAVSASSPLCQHLNSTTAATVGHWVTEKWKNGNTSRWVVNSTAGCVLANLTGIDTVDDTVGTLFVFLGDSILRQVFHTFVFGTLRQMPIIVDPLYGTAHYTAVPNQGGKFASDVMYIEPKDSHHPAFSHKHIGSSLLQHWNTSTGVEAGFVFLNTCPHVLRWTNDLLQSRHGRTLAGTNASNARRVVFVTNVGATNIDGNMESLECLKSELPLAFFNLSSQWNQTVGMLERKHRYVLMTQPTEHNRFRHSDHSEPIHEAAYAGLSLLSGADFVESQLLDFAGLLTASFRDPGAPPDAGWAMLEDGIHYGCQWIELSKHTKAVGRTHSPTNLKGTRVPFPFNISTSNSTAVLECHGALLRALVNLLLTPLSSGHQARPTLGPEQSYTYQVLKCFEEYDAVPCPLYEVLEDGNSSASRLYESPLSRNKLTMKNQHARLETSHKRKVPAHLLDSENSKWCMDALGGPGGVRFQEIGVSLNSSRPQGVWCSLPAAGVWKMLQSIEGDDSGITQPNSSTQFAVPGADGI